MATNTAVYSGTNGVATFNSADVASVISFTVTQTGDTIETSAMGSSSRTYIPGLKSFSGTMDLFFRDEDSANQALFAVGNNPVVLDLYPSGKTTGVHIHGNVIITSHEVTAANDGAVTASVSFQGTGDLTKEDL